VYLDLLGRIYDYSSLYPASFPTFIIYPKALLGFELDVEGLIGRGLYPLEIHWLFGKFEFCAGRSQQLVYGFRNQPECR